MGVLSDVVLLPYLFSLVGAGPWFGLAEAALAGFMGYAGVFRVFTCPTPPIPNGLLDPAVFILHPFASRWGLPNSGHLVRVHESALWPLNHAPRTLLALNKTIKPIAKSIGVFNLIEPPHMVAIQLKTLIPVGTAIIVGSRNRPALRTVRDPLGSYGSLPNARPCFRRYFVFCG